jgi:ADP-ribose pyrophosphatase YjhB (NUDIX family)
MAPPSQATEYRFCPRCAGRLETRRLKADEPPRLCCSACGFVFYLDPKVAACTIFMVDGGILLLRRSIEPQLGKWVFPGGFVDRGETVDAAAVRETLEECRVHVALSGVLDVYSSPDREVVVIVYAAHPLAGAPQAGDECSEVRLFAPEAIPWSELAFDSTRAALRDYLRRFFPRVRLPRRP